MSYVLKSKSVIKSVTEFFYNTRKCIYTTTQDEKLFRFSIVDSICFTLSLLRYVNNALHKYRYVFLPFLLDAAVFEMPLLSVSLCVHYATTLTSICFIIITPSEERLQTGRSLSSFGWALWSFRSLPPGIQ